MQHPTFMDGYTTGDFHDEDIHNWIAEWNGRFQRSDVTLHEYLGMSVIEYFDWSSERRTLKQIVADRGPHNVGFINRILSYVLCKLFDKIL